MNIYRQKDQQGHPENDGCNFQNLFRQCTVLFLMLASLASVSPVEAENQVLSFASPWIREAPPGVPTLAAYMDITNDSGLPVVIVDVSSQIAKRTELHAVKMANDVMQMRKMDEVTLQPGETLKLKSGGSHVMLMGVEKSFNEGDEIEIEFELKDQTSVKVVVPIKKDL